ncbi:DapH/DapD/GlmU-related protein [Maribacter sp. PR1]|uniref:DapH/DapD/GlmU-related protein n=1 Tax=Maribacter cobaltidurans TaxID=1178778 RepID=A0ABU7IT86_9FLAO|nr:MULTISPECIES: DapH/DapD/GlmU-related protein [Maribacter]MDC6388805.1 DapH/DapD/GlmU-related protein [Maribacter sp. PR1]MEE1976194.1 DapH/DapD/GlmU-related protein [Maribacter cobaltidurans]
MQNIVIFGASGHSIAVLDCIEKEGKYKVIGFIDPFKKMGTYVNGYPILGNVKNLQFLVEKYKIYGGIIGFKDVFIVKKLIERVKKIIPDFNFLTTIELIEVEKSYSKNKKVLPTDSNYVKAEKIGQTKEVDSLIHPLANVQTEKIGKSTKVWQFSVILENAKIGENSNINSHTFIENDVVIGNNVTIKCGVYLWDGSRIEDDVFIGPNVTFSNDKYPRSKQYPSEFQNVWVKKGASIGSNSTILGGVSIGQNSMIGAGSLVTKNVPDGELWIGSPAIFVRKINRNNLFLELSLSKNSD